MLGWGQVMEGLQRGHTLGIARLPPRGVIGVGASDPQSPLILASYFLPCNTHPWAAGPWQRSGREATCSDPPWGSPHSTSPQVLETCMKSCGKRFHDEVGKFRFLNELIKVVSPKVGAPSPSSELRRQMGGGIRLTLGPPPGAPTPTTASAPFRI